LYKINQLLLKIVIYEVFLYKNEYIVKYFDKILIYIDFIFKYRNFLGNIEWKLQIF